MFSFAVVFSNIRQVSNHCHNPLDLPKPTSDCLGKDYSGRAAAWRKLSWAAVLSSWLPTNYQPRCYLHSHSKNLMHFQINKGCAKIHFVSINFFLKHPFNCPICENTESIPQKITSRLPGEPKWTAPPRRVDLGVYIQEGLSKAVREV